MKTIAVSILVLFGAFGCASEDPSHPMAPDDSSRVAGVAFDPVSHVEVSTTSPWKSLWKGTWYYFESDDNKLKFDVNPEAYIGLQERTPKERRKVYPHQVQ
jgi:YHS domain-containing protein